MKVPRIHRVVTAKVLMLAALVTTASLLPAAAGGKPEAPLSIPVAPLGFQELPGQFRSTFATMFTLNFVDDGHLLFTFTSRKLMPRLPDAEPNDDDRNVTALLLELPSGKVIGHTEWRTRDHDRYLWPLEHGRFLLRVRAKLSVLDPMRMLARTGDAFREQTFLDFKRPIGYMTVSPGGDLLGVETLPPRKPKLVGGAASTAALATTVAGYKPEPELHIKGRPPVQIYFFRLHEEKTDGQERLFAQSAGLIGAETLINLPATGEGYLDIKQQSNATWLFDFVSHEGKRLELSAFDTSCAPRPYFVSRSEFVAFGCRGAADHMELSYFNLKGEQPWISVLGGTQVSPSILAAPAAGRFVMNRTLVNSTLIDTDNLTQDDMLSQEITVMQNFDGRTLLKVQATPIQRSGQNFDLTANGRKFAVLRGGNIEVYSLPALNGKDQKAVEMAERLAPDQTDVPIKLDSVPVDSAAATTAINEEPRLVPAPAPKASAVIAPAAAVLPVSAPVPPAKAPADTPTAVALPASESMQSGSGAATQEALGDPQGRTGIPSLYSADYPRKKGDPPPSKKSETPQ